MIDQSLAHPAHPTTRELRGLKLYRDHGDEIEPLGRGKYLVPGCSGGAYVVNLDVFGEGEETCECPDHARHLEYTCKHIVAATIHRAKARAEARKGKRPGYAPEAVAANLARMGA